MDKHESKSLAYSTVLIEETGQGVSSDELGSFIIDNLCVGEYTLLVRHIGCEPIQQKVKLSSDTSITFYLEHHTELLALVDVHSKRLKPKNTIAESSISGVELNRIRGKSLAESLLSFAGLNSINTGGNISKPVIHGLHSSRIQIMNQGVQQEGQAWSMEHAPEIDPFAATELRVIKGVGAIEYGTAAMGGVILVESAPLPEDLDWRASLNVVGMSNGQQLITSGNIATRLSDAWTFGVQSSLKRAGDLHSPNYQLTNTGVREFNFSTAVNYSSEKWKSELFWSRFNTEIGILRSAHIGNLSDLEIALQSERPFFIEDFSYNINNPKQAVEHHLVKWKNEWQLSKGRLDFTYSFQQNHRQEFDIRRGERDNIPAIDLKLQANRLKSVWHHPTFLQSIVGKVGIEAVYIRNRNISGTGIRPLIPWYDNYEWGIFWTEKWVGDPIQIEWGVRYDYSFMQVKKFNSQNELEEPNFQRSGFSLALGGIYRPNSFMTLTSNLGYSFRPPNINELFSEGLHHGSAAIEEGNQTLATEKGLKWITALTFEKQNAFSIELDAYVHYIANYIYLRPEAEPRLTIRGAFPVFTYTQTDARLYGFDLNTEVQLPFNLNLHLKGAIIRATDLDLEEPLFMMPADRFEGNLFYSIAGNRLIKDVRIGLGYQYVAEQTRVAEGIDLAAPPAAYNLLRAELSSNVSIGENTLGIILSIENLSNTVYRDYLNRLRYYADDVGRNIVLRLNYRFSK